MLGVLISKEEYEEYQILKKKNTPMRKIDCRWNRRCPMCSYVVDSAVPKQYYCDRCGQNLAIESRI